MAVTPKYVRNGVTFNWLWLDIRRKTTHGWEWLHRRGYKPRRSLADPEYMTLKHWNTKLMKLLLTRMYSSRMRTARSLPYGGSPWQTSPWTETPLEQRHSPDRDTPDRDHPRQRPPDRDPPDRDPPGYVTCNAWWDRDPHCGQTNTRENITAKIKYRQIWRPD